MPTQAVRFMKLKPAVSISTFGWCHMKEHVSFRAGSTCDLLVVFTGGISWDQAPHVTYWWSFLGSSISDRKKRERPDLPLGRPG